MREKITQEVVWRLADELTDEGVAPTVMNIRERNGDHGSPNTINPLLRSWKRERQEQAQQATEPDKPMPENLSELLKPVWAAMLREARAEIASLQEGFENALKDKDAELADYSNTIERLTAQRNTAQATNDEQAQEIEQLKAQCAESEALADKLGRTVEEQGRLMLAKDKDMALTDKRLAENLQDLKVLETKVAAQEGQITQLNMDLAAAHANIKTMNDELTNEAKHTDRAIQEKDKVAAELKTVAQELTVEKRKAEKQAEDARNKLFEVEKQLAMSKGRADTLAEQLATLTAELKEQDKKPAKT